jgi:hypothetical protein
VDGTRTLHLSLTGVYACRSQAPCLSITGAVPTHLFILFTASSLLMLFFKEVNLMDP